MSRDVDAWRHGRKIWERLGGWHRDDASAPAHPDDGDSALRALADIGVLRRLLDQAELGAVRTARRHARSWAEIATRLGVTRQSAWERWRDLDEAPTGGVSTGTASVPEPVGVPDPLPDAAAAVARAAGELRRRSGVRVPDVIGQRAGAACAILGRAGLDAVGADPDGTPLALVPDAAVVTDQSPEAGAKVPPRTRVTLWLDAGGGAGVREPRRPRPRPRSGQAERDEPFERSAS